MKSKHLKYECSNCGAIKTIWEGRCGSCKSWNTFVEKEKNCNKNKANKKICFKPYEIKFDKEKSLRIKFHNILCNEFFGNSLEKGSFNLLSGPPGCGKSTLMLTLIKELYLKETKVLYISGEENLTQVKSKLDRLNVNHQSLWLTHDSLYENILDSIKDISPDVLIIDSVQTLKSLDNTTSGSISLIKEVIEKLVFFTKKKEMTTFIIGHINKAGDIAGPKHLEHMVDSVANVERQNQILSLKYSKNRFSALDKELNYKILDNKLEFLKPEELLVKGSKETYIGKTTGVFLQNSKVNISKIESLVIQNYRESSKRIIKGGDLKELNIAIALIEYYCKINLGRYDIYVSVLNRSNRLAEDELLSLVCSIMSSYYQRAIPQNLIFSGKIELSGEVKTNQEIYNCADNLKSLGYNQVIGQLKNKIKKGFKSVQRINELKEYMFN